MFIETDRLVLRSFKPEDSEDLYEYLSVAEIYRFEPGRPLSMSEAANESFRRVEDNTFIAVERKEDHKLIGHLYFALDDDQNKNTWSLGYIFHPKFQRAGYCTEACKAIVEDAFKNRNAHRVEAKCSTENIGSNRVLQKLGMRLEGTMMKNVYFHTDEEGNPRWFNTNIYALLSEEWVG